MTGKYSSLDDPAQAEGRFGSASPISGAAYSARYWKQKVFEALEIVRPACETAGIPLAEASLRWVSGRPSSCEASGCRASRDALRGGGGEIAGR